MAGGYDIELLIRAILDKGYSQAQIKSQLQQIEEEVQKTPIQLRIEAATGVAQNEVNKITNMTKSEYTKMYADLLRQHDQMQSAISATEIKRIKDTEKAEAAQAQTQNRAYEEMRIAKEKQVQQDIANAEKVSDYQRNALLKIQNLLEGQNKNFVDKTALGNLSNDIRNLDSTAPDFERRMQDINFGIRQVGSEADNAARSSLKLGDSFKTAAVKMLR